MAEIGQKIKELRKKKGLSQEELAENSNVNLRTIQRIENNESEPRGKTLNMICKTLETNTEDILDYWKQTDTGYLVAFQLSALCFVFMPIGNVLIPLILWLNKKDKIIGLKEIGTNLLNFQIVWTIAKFISGIIFALLNIMKYKNIHYTIWGMFFIGLLILNVILPIIFSIKTKRGKTKHLYPTIIRFIK